jgi:hypothetical protein
MAISIANCLLGVMKAVRPSRLTLGHGGMRYETWLRTRRWRWDEITGIRGKYPAITFLGRGRPVKIRPPPVEYGGISIAWAMREAQARWA